MATVNVCGWTGIFKNIFDDETGGTTLSSDGYTFDVFFNVSDLYIDGQPCPEGGNILDYLSEGDTIHFDAQRFRKPVYQYGYNVWYQAKPVWVGQMPAFKEVESTVDGSSVAGDSNVDEPDVDCTSGQVIKFVNKSTVVLITEIDGKKTLVALERSRLYINGQVCSKNSALSNLLNIDEWVQFEAFHLDLPHPSGVEYRVCLAWQGWRPDIDLSYPPHDLNIPAEPLFPKAQPQHTGYFIALPNKSVAVVKSSIGGQAKLVAVERCRLYVDGTALSATADIRMFVKLGQHIDFESFLLCEDLECGVTHRASLSWVGQRPKVQPPLPTHTLDLPRQLFVDLEQGLAGGIFK